MRQVTKVAIDEEVCPKCKKPLNVRLHSPFSGGLFCTDEECGWFESIEVKNPKTRFWMDASTNTLKVVPTIEPYHPTTRQVGLMSFVQAESHRASVPSHQMPSGTLSAPSHP